MGYEFSWDPESESEYHHWLKSNLPTLAEKKACARLLALMKEEYLDVGPGDLSQCETSRRKDGNEVEIYCQISNRKIAMCFGVYRKQIHMVVMGPYNEPGLWNVAKERINRW